MPQTQLKTFLEKVKGDSSLQEKLKATKSPEDVTGIAKDHVHEFTSDKINQLSEEELEGMAWGLIQNTILGSQCICQSMFDMGSLTHQSSRIDRAFYCFNSLTNPINSLQHLARLSAAEQKSSE